MGHRRGRRLIGVAWLLGAVALGVGAVQLGTAWSGGAATLVLALAVLVPYGAGAVRRVPPLASALVVVTLPFLCGYGFGVRSADAWWSVVRDGVPRLLTVPRPAPSTVELLLPAVLPVVLLGLWVGLRPGRFAPLVGAVVLYLGAALLTAGAADPHGLAAAAILACAVVSWSRPEHAVVATLAGSVVAAGLAAVALPGTPFEPRRYVALPPQPLVERSPLTRLAALAADRDLFRHTGAPGRLRLVALADFDGASWTADARYRPIGAAGQPAGRHRIEVSVTVDALAGPWLPSLGTPAAVSLPDARVDPESGSLVLPGGLRTGLRYRVDAWVDAPADADLVVAGVPADARYLAVPRLPFLFAEYARRVVDGANTPFEQAVLIEAAVRSQGRLSTSAPAGSSYARLESFLFGPPAIRVGTAEQFATAYAVLARASGLPTRVVVGFRPGRRTPSGDWVVRGRDALAWPEVFFTGVGWVAFDPTPTQTPDPGGVAETLRQQVLDRVGSGDPRPAPVATVAPPPPPAGKSDRAAPADQGAGRPRLGRLASTTVLVALGVLLAARVRRRWRHRRAGARGAWSEVLDLLVLLGRRPPHWRPTHWVAADLAALTPVDGPHPALRLADLADRATFAPAGSPVESPWPELRRLRRAIRRHIPWYRRITWPLDPRPLI